MKSFYQLIGGPVNEGKRTKEQKKKKNYNRFDFGDEFWLWENLQKILVVFVHEKSDHNCDAFLMFTDAVDDQHGTIIFECGFNELHRFVAIR